MLNKYNKIKENPVLTSHSFECIREFVSIIEGFKELSVEILDILVKNVKIMEYKRGDFIIRRGEHGNTMYIIGSGVVIVPIIDKFANIEKFEDLVFLYSGSIFGEMALLTNDVRSADVIAESKVVTLLEIDKAQVDLLLKESPLFGEFLTELLRQRLKDNKTSDKYIGKYKVMGLLGKGATADVYKISNMSIGKNFAIKVLNHSMLEQGANLMKEAKLLANLSHRNIIQIFDLEQAYGTIGIIMEELNGQSLDKIIAERRKSGHGFSYIEILNMIRQLAEGISYANKNGIVHKDIKPANCMYIEDSNTVKLMDFGISERINSNIVKPITGLQGTPLYIAPETILGKDVDYKADIYSLGVIAYEMAAGRKLFESNNLLELLKMHTDTMPDFSPLPDDLPNGLIEFIKGSLIKNPNERLSDWKRIKYLLDSDLVSLQDEIMDEAEKNDDSINNEEQYHVKSFSSKFKNNVKGFIHILSNIIEANDIALFKHCQRVVILANAIGERLGLSLKELEGLQMAALIHDIGKVVISSDIINKPDKLIANEFDIIKTHPQIGYDLIKAIEFDQPVALIVYQHHEKINGSGYPNGLFSKDILPMSKILCVADVLEAMSSERPYREAQFIEVAIEELSINKGILYDSDVVDTCLELFTENILLEIFQ